MKHRDIFRVPARAVEKPEGWFIRVTMPGAEVDFFHGPDKPAFSTPAISLILEYMVPDAPI